MRCLLGGAFQLPVWYACDHKARPIQAAPWSQEHQHLSTRMLFAADSWYGGRSKWLGECARLPYACGLGRAALQ